MFNKIINSYDIHINSQQLRIVEKSELLNNNTKINYTNLLYKEPRGSKYVTLLVFEIYNDLIDVDLYSYFNIENKEILLKSFLKSLLDRGKIDKKEVFKIKLNEDLYQFEAVKLNYVDFYEVKKKEHDYFINNSKFKVRHVDFDINIDEIETIKSYLKTVEVKNDEYLLLINHNTVLLTDNYYNIIAYPTIEVLSLLSSINIEKEILFLNGLKINLKNKFYFDYHLISNSQFYFDEEDIYSKGYIVK